MDVCRLLKYSMLPCCLTLTLAFSGCKPKIPGEYIQPGEMEDILYEYYLSEEVIRQSGGDTLSQLSFMTNILMRHGVTRTDFDSSMVYYTRHTEELHKIYESLAARFTNEAMAQGASVNEMSRFGNLASSSDTTDITSGKKTVLLFPYAAFNRHMFRIKADTAFHKGDRIMLDFDTRFIYQDGMRNSAAVLAVKFANDSVASKTIQISSTSHYHMQVEDNDRLGIKEVGGYFMLNDNSQASGTTTLRMMAVTGIRLIRMHVRPEGNRKVEGDKSKKPDSIAEPGKTAERQAPRTVEGELVVPNAMLPMNRQLAPKELKIKQIKK